jgi:hypothetical protein
MRYQLILIIAWLISVPTLAGDQPVRFGIMETWPSRLACLTVKGPQLKLGQRLHFLAFDPPGWVRGEVVSKRLSPCREHALEGTAYDVQLEQYEDEKYKLGIALVAAEGTPVIEKGDPLFISRGADSTMSFQQCTGGEGVNFFAWRENKRLWHEYYYLGYDVKPTCSDEELENKKR